MGGVWTVSCWLPVLWCVSVAMLSSMYGSDGDNVWLHVLVESRLDRSSMR
jgi:hypothetical protein